MVRGSDNRHQTHQEEDKDDEDGIIAAAESHYADQKHRIMANRRAAIRKQFGDRISVEQYDRSANNSSEAPKRREKRRCTGESNTTPRMGRAR